MAETVPADDDGGIAERVVDVLVEKILPFPWVAGLAAGSGAFVLGYLVLGGYYLIGLIKELPGTTTEKLTQLGFIHYNAHMIGIIPTAAEPLPEGQNIARTSYSLISNAADPGVYYAVPVVALLVGSAALTYWYDPDEQSTAVAVMTGVSMTLGYLLFALLGTFVFAQTQTTDPVNAEPIKVIYHPDRLGTLVFGFLYPLVVGFVGSIPAQIALTKDD